MEGRADFQASDHVPRRSPKRVIRGIRAAPHASRAAFPRRFLVPSHHPRASVATLGSTLRTHAQNDSVPSAEGLHGPVEHRSDALLLAAARRGEMDAFGQLFSRYRSASVRIARRAGVLETDIDDVVADVWARILSAINGGRGPTDNFPGYLATAIRRGSWACFEHKVAFVPTEDVAVLDGAMMDDLHESLADTSVGQALGRLPHSWREVIWRVDVEGEKVAAIAAERGQSANSISAIASRARRRLRAELAQDDPRSDDAGFLGELRGCRPEPSLGVPGERVPRSTATTGVVNQLQRDQALEFKGCDLALRDASRCPVAGVEEVA